MSNSRLSPAPRVAPVSVTLTLTMALGLVGCGVGPLARSEDHLKRGERLAAEGKGEEAALAYRKAIQKDERLGVAYLRLGQLLKAQERPAEAYPLLAKAAELMPQSDEARVALAQLALDGLLGTEKPPQKLYEIAKDIAAQLLQRDAKSFEGLRIQGFLAMADSHPKEAAGWFQKALAVKPERADILTAVVQNLLADNQAEAAVALARKGIDGVAKGFGPLYDALYRHYRAAKQNGEAEELLKTKIANNPKEAFCVVQLADHYWNSKDLASANAVIQKMVDGASELPRAYFEAGDFYRRRRRFEEAIAVYQKGLSADAGAQVEYRERLAGTYLEAGNLAAAGTTLDELLKANPEDAKALISRAAVRLAANQPEETRKAIVDLADMAKAQPENLEVRMSLSRAYRQAGDEAEAKAALLQVLRADPRHREALRELADLAIRQQKPEEALRYAERLLDIDPNHVGARLVRTAAWALLGRGMEVRAELRRLAAEFPGMTEPRLQLATLSLQEGNLAEAERLYQGLRAEMAGDVRPVKGLMAVAIGQGQPKKALELGRADAGLARHPEIRALLATAMAGTGDLEGALKIAQGLAEELPANPDHWLFSGQLLQQKGDMEGAVAAFEKAVAAAPKQTAPLAYLGNAYAELGRSTPAIETYRKALALKPDDPLMMNNLAFHLAEANRSLQEAEKLVGQALQMVPGNLQFSDTQGLVWLRSGRAEAALGAFRRLVTKEPGNATYRYHLAQAYGALGQRAQAKQEIETALNRHPGGREAQQMKELLSTL